MPGAAERAQRAARDDALAAALRHGGLDSFLHDWYQLPLWVQLRSSPRFQAMLAQRRRGGDACQLATVLAAASPGRAPSLWQELPAAAAGGRLPPLLLVAGGEDAKFVGVAERLAAELRMTAGGPTQAAAPILQVEVVLVPGAGHAVHIERPVELLAALQQFCDDLARQQLQLRGVVAPLNRVSLP